MEIAIDGVVQFLLVLQLEACLLCRLQITGLFANASQEVVAVITVLRDGLVGVVEVYSDFGSHFLLMVMVVHISELFVSELEGGEGHGEV